MRTQMIDQALQFIRGMGATRFARDVTFAAFEAAGSALDAYVKVRPLNTRFAELHRRIGGLLAQRNIVTDEVAGSAASVENVANHDPFLHIYVDLLHWDFVTDREGTVYLNDSGNRRLRERLDLVRQFCISHRDDLNRWSEGICRDSQEEFVSGLARRLMRGEIDSTKGKKALEEVTDRIEEGISMLPSAPYGLIAIAYWHSATTPSSQTSARRFLYRLGSLHPRRIFPLK